MHSHNAIYLHKLLYECGDKALTVPCIAGLCPENTCYVLHSLITTSTKIEDVEPYIAHLFTPLPRDLYYSK